MDYLSSEVLAKHEGGRGRERTNIAIEDYLPSEVLAKHEGGGEGEQI